MRNTLLTGASSYLQMGVVIITQLLTIPLALHYLGTERFGLWSFVAQSIGYLMLLDFGVGNSIGRLMVEPLQSGDPRTWNGWFNMIWIVLLLQGVLLLGFGLALSHSILYWFNIPAALFDEAKLLWITSLVLYSINFPFRILTGVLYAQNRYYCNLLASTCSCIVWFAVFAICLKLGYGSFAYAISLAAQIATSVTLHILAVIKGPNRLTITLANIPWEHIKELFGFSSAVFVCAIAIQITFMSQTLIITKILGLGAVAGFTVCSKVPSQLMQLVWRPFDAFNGRWQIFWAQGDTDTLAKEYSRMLRLTIGLALLAMTFSLAMNRWFVIIFGKEALYQGKLFDFFFIIFVVAQEWIHCVSYCFIQAKKMKGYATVVAIDAALGMLAAIIGTKWYGLLGFIAFSGIYNLLGLGVLYMTLRGPRLLSLDYRSLLRQSASTVVLFGGLLAAALAVFQQVSRLGRWPQIGAEIGLVILASALFSFLFRNELLTAFAYARQAIAKRRAQKAEPTLVS